MRFAEWLSLCLVLDVFSKKALFSAIGSRERPIQSWAVLSSQLKGSCEISVYESVERTEGGCCHVRVHLADPVVSVRYF